MAEKQRASIDVHGADAQDCDLTEAVPEAMPEAARSVVIISEWVTDSLQRPTRSLAVALVVLTRRGPWKDNEDLMMAVVGHGVCAGGESEPKVSLATTS